MAGQRGIPRSRASPVASFVLLALTGVVKVLFRRSPAGREIGRGAPAGAALLPTGGRSRVGSPDGHCEAQLSTLNSHPGVACSL